MEGFFKYKHALLLKGVYRKNSYGNEEQLHLNNTSVWKWKTWLHKQVGVNLQCWATLGHLLTAW